MKIYILPVLLCAMVGNSNAQFRPGSMALSGNLNWTSDHNSPGNASYSTDYSSGLISSKTLSASGSDNVSIGASLLKFRTEKKASGFGLAVVFNQNESQNETNYLMQNVTTHPYKSDQLTVSPFLNWRQINFHSIRDKWGWLHGFSAGAGYSYTSGQTVQRQTAYDSTGTPYEGTENKTKLTTHSLTAGGGAFA